MSWANMRNRGPRGPGREIAPPFSSFARRRSAAGSRSAEAARAIARSRPYGPRRLPGTGIGTAWTPATSGDGGGPADG